MSQIIVIFSTAGSLEEARKIGQTLVDEGLVACCNIVQSVESIFRWKGELQNEREVLMICKARHDSFGRVEKRIKESHSYEVPEIIAVPVTHGSKKYLDWVLDETKNNR
ncbi:MAG: divalent-cation tolerance protein CutA [Candidatus Loosdrechtia sp.]|uniref:divalent-cation tolerance protein CutA n=1 Tax=Candidatus Loosdrechtia sp. TaxID=3101272 RepID=UPI003A655116|nr:MAG: divalent-cation tolerance protein CutA [Candidatus Jettenia sp. AMX2]